MPHDRCFARSRKLSRRERCECSHTVKEWDCFTNHLLLAARLPLHVKARSFAPLPHGRFAFFQDASKYITEKYDYSNCYNMNNYSYCRDRLCSKNYEENYGELPQALAEPTQRLWRLKDESP